MNTPITGRSLSCFGLIVLVLSGAPTAVLAESPLTLKQVLEIALEQDLDTRQLRLQSQAQLAASDGEKSLPDPTLFASFSNLPVDTFELDQEPMTQLRVGLRQMFPRGESLELKQSAGIQEAKVSDEKAELRQLKLKREVEQNWMEAWYWQERLGLLDQDAVFLKQVRDFVQSLYQVGARTQSDLLGAELELIKLRESQVAAQRQFERSRRQLDNLSNTLLPGEGVERELPYAESTIMVMGAPNTADNESIERALIQHPALRVVARQLDLSDTHVDLYRQAYKPAWGVEVAYGLRDGNNMDGSSRADFFSAGVSMQWPLFSSDRQDAKVKAARIKQSEVRLNQDLRIQQARLELVDLRSQLKLLRQQKTLYREEILPTLKAQKKSALQSYEADKGSFEKVMSLYLKEQMALSQHLRLIADEQILFARWSYWMNAEQA